jgi:hypothetical protein
VTRADFALEALDAAQSCRISHRLAFVHASAALEMALFDNPPVSNQRVVLSVNLPPRRDPSECRIRAMSLAVSSAAFGERGSKIALRGSFALDLRRG